MSYIESNVSNVYSLEKNFKKHAPLPAKFEHCQQMLFALMESLKALFSETLRTEYLLVSLDTNLIHLVVVLNSHSYPNKKNVCQKLQLLQIAINPKLWGEHLGQHVLQSLMEIS